MPWLSLIDFQIKGLSWKESKAQANLYLASVGLNDKANIICSKLSGKRENRQQGIQLCP